MKLMTQFDYSAWQVPGEGTYISLVKFEGDKRFLFFMAGDHHDLGRVRTHMNSLTDDLCEQWFPENLTKEQRKAKQAVMKEKARLEREALEAKVAAQKAETARLKAEEKAREKARKHRS